MRFYKEETENDPTFAKQLASLADIYVNDAFGVAHRKHASTYGVARLLPNAIGFLVENEINLITNALENPKSPFVAIFGGAKVEDKIKAILNILKTADTVLIGGAMAYSFMMARGQTIGRSFPAWKALKPQTKFWARLKEWAKEFCCQSTMWHIIMATKAARVCNRNAVWRNGWQRYRSANSKSV